MFDSIAPISLLAKGVAHVARKKSFDFALRLINGSECSSGFITKLYKNIEGKVSLYIHIPFCIAPCRFCCFVRFPYKEDKYWLYMKALQAEIEETRSKLERTRVESVYIGGGTPSVNAEGLVWLLDIVRENFPEASTLTVEINPSDATPELLQAMRETGVNRVSIGIQSLRTKTLKRLGRRQKISEAVRAIAIAAKTGFPTINADLMFSVPGQDITEVLEDASYILRLGANQLTFYPLIPGIGAKRELVERILGSLDYTSDLKAYNAIEKHMEREGLSPLTPWCYAKGKAPLDEYIVEYTDYVAVGLSGIGKVGSRVYVNTFNVNKYVKKVLERGFSCSKTTVLTRSEAVDYDLFMEVFGLRLSIEHFLTTWGAIRVLPILPLIKVHKGIIEPAFLARYLIHVAMREFLSVLAWMRTEALARNI